MDEQHGERALPLCAVGVGVAALMIRSEQLCALLVQRREEPFKGDWALPEGFAQRGSGRPAEGLDGAAERVFRVETGIDLKAAYVAQIGAYGDPGRDPRGDVVTVAYLAVAPVTPQLKPRPRPVDNVRVSRFIPVDVALEAGSALAFDHGRILADAVQRTLALVESTALAVAFCKEWFTIPYLRRVYEILWDLPSGTLDAGNFHHRIMKLSGLVEPVSEEELEARASEDRTIERRLGMMATLGEAETGRGRPPRWFKRGPLIREGGPAAPLERPFVRPRA
ncbi:MAG: NUDIX domain-containing protein [Thermoleophilia bacterium]|nr:NUDIX domain-containing protein [Thermoleophilia bacterium]